MPVQCSDGSCTCSGVATPGPTRAQALVKFVCALVKLLNSWAKNMILATITAPKLLKIYGYIATIIA